jgi:hypothetical protein
MKVCLQNFKQRLADQVFVDAFLCPLCDKNISKYNDTRRLNHINRCMETASENEREALLSKVRASKTTNTEPSDITGSRYDSLSFYAVKRVTQYVGQYFSLMLSSGVMECKPGAGRIFESKDCIRSCSLSRSLMASSKEEGEIRSLSVKKENLSRHISGAKISSDQPSRYIEAYSQVCRAF